MALEGHCSLVLRAGSCCPWFLISFDGPRLHCTRPQSRRAWYAPISIVLEVAVQPASVQLLNHCVDHVNLFCCSWAAGLPLSMQSKTLSTLSRLALHYRYLLPGCRNPCLACHKPTQLAIPLVTGPCMQGQYKGGTFNSFADVVAIYQKDSCHDAVHITYVLGATRGLAGCLSLSAVPCTLRTRLAVTVRDIVAFVWGPWCGAYMQQHC